MELYNNLLRLQHIHRDRVLSVGLLVERGKLQPQMCHLPIVREGDLQGNCWTLGQILLNVMQSNEPLYALADISRVQIIDQINVNWQIFQGSQIIKICCFGMSSIDKDKARQINADDDDDIISITDSELS